MSATVSAIIDGLGGTGEVASELDLAMSTVSGWRERGIPSRRWPAIVGLARRKRKPGITFEVLASLPVEARA